MKTRACRVSVSRRGGGLGSSVPRAGCFYGAGVPVVTLASGPMLSYDDRGEASSPAVPVLPAQPDSWRSYQPVLDRLPPGLRAVAVSQRGHGDSDKPAAGYRVCDFAAHVVALLDRLGIEQAVLTGPSCLVPAGSLSSIRTGWQDWCCPGTPQGSRARLEGDVRGDAPDLGRRRPLGHAGRAEPPRGPSLCGPRRLPSAGLTPRRDDPVRFSDDVARFAAR